MRQRSKESRSPGGREDPESNEEFEVSGIQIFEGKKIVPNYYQTANASLKQHIVKSSVYDDRDSLDSPRRRPQTAGVAA